MYASSIHLPFIQDKEEEQKQKKNYSLILKNSFHSTSRNQSAIALTLLGVAGVALGGSIALDAIARRQAENPTTTSTNTTGDATGQQQSHEGENKTQTNAGSLFSSFFGAKNFYQGGFESQMTKREAALILGVRESAPREKIREAHRNMSRINHPDTGGSPYLAQKINEAKDLLLGSK
jgi:hypothetical protein